MLRCKEFWERASVETWSVDTVTIPSSPSRTLLSTTSWGKERSTVTKHYMFFAHVYFRFRLMPTIKVRWWSFIWSSLALINKWINDQPALMRTVSHIFWQESPQFTIYDLSSYVDVIFSDNINPQRDRWPGGESLTSRWMVKPLRVTLFEALVVSGTVSNWKTKLITLYVSQNSESLCSHALYSDSVTRTKIVSHSC